MMLSTSIAGEGDCIRFTATAHEAGTGRWRELNLRWYRCFRLSENGICGRPITIRTDLRSRTTAAFCILSGPERDHAVRHPCKLAEPCEASKSMADGPVGVSIVFQTLNIFLLSPLLVGSSSNRNRRMTLPAITGQWVKFSSAGNLSHSAVFQPEYSSNFQTSAPRRILPSHIQWTSNIIIQQYPAEQLIIRMLK